jgi:hypothetical protein
VAFAAWPLAGAAQTPSAATGAITGIVRDSAGLRLGQVAIGVVGASGQLAASHDSGTYHIAAISAGATRLFARRVGYAPETLSVVVIAGELTRADFVMRASAQILPEALVEADPTRGKMGAFNRRKSRGVGAFVTRADIEKRQPGSISELLRYLPGVGVTQKMAGEPQPIHMERSVARACKRHASFRFTSTDIRTRTATSTTSRPFTSRGSKSIAAHRRFPPTFARATRPAASSPSGREIPTPREGSRSARDC